MKKVMSIMLSAMMMVMLFAMPVFATNENGFTLGSDANVSPTPLPGAGAKVAQVIGVIQWIGYAIAIGMLVYIGIKYIMASANDKAELKNAMVKYIIGAILIAGASTIAGWVFNSSIF